MLKLFPFVFLMAFWTITGSVLITLIVIGMFDVYSITTAVIVGLIVSLGASWVISKQILVEDPAYDEVRDKPAKTAY